MQLAGLNHRADRAERMRSRIRRSGLTPMGYRIWTEDEDSVLRSHYPDYRKMTDELPHRNRRSVRVRCQKLGMKKTCHKWLASELSKLRRLYRIASSKEIMAEFPGFTWKAIDARARYHGLKRETTFRYKRTGKPIMDSILDRIEELGWTLPDLDEASGTRRYFWRHTWRNSRLNMKMIQLAVKALGGDLVVKWKDYD